MLKKDKSVRDIFHVVFKETESGKPGISITKLSKKTGIEQHRLAGMLQVLTIVGAVAIFEVGMTKLIRPSKLLKESKKKFFK